MQSEAKNPLGKEENSSQTREHYHDSWEFVLLDKGGRSTKAAPPEKKKKKGEETRRGDYLYRFGGNLCLFNAQWIQLRLGVIRW